MFAPHYLGGMAQQEGKPIKTIEKDTDRDFFMSAEEARSYGLIDSVLDHLPSPVAPTA